MRPAALVLATLVLAGCAVGGSAKTTTVTVTRTVTTQTTAKSPQSGALSQTENARYFGTPVSITQVDAKSYLLVLKPQFFLVGVTANVAFAAQQNSVCAPLQCPGVPDDRWVVPAGSQQLTFILPATTTGTVITVGHQQMHNTKVTAAQLSALVAGATTPKLIEPLDSGVWLTVDVDKVTSFAQQFQP
ncbi:MAG TPA: hypothetical protein VKR79_11650 [Gaiellaceae bacterium]|nr:hypothetical protein [Gaiellaceae bacterium]